MDAELQRNCTQCGQPFWWSPADQEYRRWHKLKAPTRCPKCKGKRRQKSDGKPDVSNPSAQISSALAALEQVGASAGNALGDLLPDPTALFQDILRLLGDAAAPIEVRRRTFSEWLRGLDLQAIQIERKLRVGNAADQLLRQRLDLIRRLQEVARLRYEAAEVQMTQRQALLQSHLEQLELEEKIGQLEALKEKRIETLRLEEAKKHMRLLNDISPPAPQPTPKQKDPLKQAIANHRRRVKAKATAKQLDISDFLKALQKVFRANVEEGIKAARIRAVMETYNQEMDALPREIRKFVERVENGEPEPPEDLAEKERQEKDQRTFKWIIHRDYNDDDLNKTDKAVSLRSHISVYHQGLDALPPEMRQFVEESEEEFGNEARTIHSADLTDTDKLLQIRALLSTYCHHATHLPQEVREFVERAEKHGGGA